jgi:hypothetical protein
MFDAHEFSPVVHTMWGLTQRLSMLGFGRRQVETVGSMEAPEKTDFLLAQMRLCLDNHDYVRAELTSQKISKKMLQQDEHQVCD